MHTHTHMHAHIHTHACTHTHTHTHTHTPPPHDIQINYLISTITWIQLHIHTQACPAHTPHTHTHRQTYNHTHPQYSDSHTLTPTNGQTYNHTYTQHSDTLTWMNVQPRTPTTLWWVSEYRHMPIPTGFHLAVRLSMVTLQSSGFGRSSLRMTDDWFLLSSSSNRNFCQKRRQTMLASLNCTKQLCISVWLWVKKENPVSLQIKSKPKQAPIKSNRISTRTVWCLKAHVNIPSLHLHPFLLTQSLNCFPVLF